MSKEKRSNAELAAQVISTAMALGTKDFVVCAGARNVPLVADLSARSAVVLWSHFDERSAAFFGLGLAKEKRKPVAIVTTSGTAVVELFPAIVEAWYSGIPLLVLTADRPARFRGSGAPQAIEQAGIFGDYVGSFVEVNPEEQAPNELCWDREKPIHFNVCFEEPQPEPVVKADPLPFEIRKREVEPVSSPFPMLDNPIVLVGELLNEDRSAVREFLLKTRIPAWFEAGSGLRECPELSVRRIDEEITVSQLSPSEVIRIGGVPSLRYWRDLEEKKTVPVVNITRTGFSGLGRIENVVNCDFSKLGELTGRVEGSSRTPSRSNLDSLLTRHPQSEPALVRKLSELISETAAIFLGNSLPIREWNFAATTSIPHPLCFANRGANGIDGELSTFLGTSASLPESWGIFGDLTTLYDLNAPWLLTQLPAGKRRIVVLNNGGGKIFSSLPSMKNLDAKTMKMAENQHEMDFAAWADLWNVEYLNWDGNQEDWELPTRDHSIIELPIDPGKTAEFREDYDRSHHPGKRDEKPSN